MLVQHLAEQETAGGEVEGIDLSNWYLEQVRKRSRPRCSYGLSTSASRGYLSTSALRSYVFTGFSGQDSEIVMATVMRDGVPRSSRSLARASASNGEQYHIAGR